MSGIAASIVGVETQLGSGEVHNGMSALSSSNSLQTRRTEISVCSARVGLSPSTKCMKSRVQLGKSILIESTVTHNTVHHQVRRYVFAELEYVNLERVVNS